MYFCERSNRHRSSSHRHDGDCEEPKARLWEPHQVTQIFHDEDLLVEQSAVSRPRRILVVVDVDRVDADESHVRVNESIDNPFGEKRIGTVPL